MKHLIILTVFAVLAIVFSSCERSYRCSCYSPSLNRTTPTFEVRGTKQDAEKECENQPQRGVYTGTDYVCNLE
ncbi:MAG TPA: hypothetical protein VIN07_04285 [Flavipsychrobacter sp.]